MSRRPHDTPLPALPLHREHLVPDLEPGRRIEPKVSVERPASKAPGCGELGRVVSWLGVPEAAGGEYPSGEGLRGGATRSAVAETSRPHSGTAREIPAIARGFGRRALVYPNRRLRVAGLEVAAARVFLCCQVGRFGFAPDSPQRRLRLSRPILKVRILLSPPISPRFTGSLGGSSRRRGRFPRFRGVLGETSGPPEPRSGRCRTIRPSSSATAPR